MSETHAGRGFGTHQAGPVVAASTLAVGIGSSLGFMIGLMSPVLQDDLHIGKAKVGLLVGLYFGSTGVGSRQGGALVDRFGARRAVVVDMAIVVVAASGAALVGSYAALAVACVLAGFGYALSTTGTNVAVAAVVPESQRARALTIKTAGVPAQVVFGSLVGPSLGERFGWRPVITGVAVIAALVGTFAWWALPAHTAAAVRRGDQRGSLPRGFVLFPLACFLLLAGTQPMFSWIVPYLRDEIGMRLTAAGRVAALGAACGVVGMVLVARWSDRVGRRLRLPAVVALSLCSGVGALLMVAGTRAGLVVAAVGFIVGVVSQLAAIGLMHTAVVDVAPSAVGRGSGVAMTGYYLGALVAPWLFGFLSDRSDGYVVPWTVCALFSASGAAVFAACRRVAPVGGASPAGGPGAPRSRP